MEEEKAEILKETGRKRWTKSLDAYLLNNLNYKDGFKYLVNIKADLMKNNKYKEYIKYNIINYINIY